MIRDQLLSGEQKVYIAWISRGFYWLSYAVEQAAIGPGNALAHCSRRRAGTAYELIRKSCHHPPHHPRSAALPHYRHCR